MAAAHLIERCSTLSHFAPPLRKHLENMDVPPQFFDAWSREG